MQNTYFRPRKRGELVEKLQDGIPCEVLASNEKTTRMLIDNWLNPPLYVVCSSENEGWVIFRAANQAINTDAAK